MILDTCGFVIEKNEITETVLKNLKKDLTVSPHNLDMCNNKEPVKYKIYRLTNNSIIIPRYFGIKKFGKPKINFKPTKSNMKFIGTLRLTQIPIVEKCLNHIKNNGGGLLSVPCGAGKTTMALYIACKLKLKTLVIVHKTFLQDQWIERCRQFTNAEIGIIRQNTVDVENKDIVIAMIQSVSKRDYDEKIFKEFGFTVYDEAHHTPAKIFSKTLQKTGAKYTLALSATPYRTDGMIKIMHWFIGDVIYKEMLKINNQVVVKIIHYDSKHENFREKKRFINGAIRPDCVKMISNLVELHERNNVIIKILNYIIKNNSDRKILLLSGRKLTHLKYLKDAIDKFINENNLPQKTYYYTGDCKQYERQDAEKNGDILFATYDMAQEALDIERLNTIVLATSKKDVVQAVGRILRKILKNGDIRPLVIDFADELSVFKSQARKREKFYEKCKYIINHYHVMDEDFHNVTIENILTIPPVEIVEETGNNAINVEEPEKKPYIKQELDVSIFDE
jgi:superfamily II DNA or RNA helicase